MITTEEKEKLINNNNKISEILKENEEILKNAGFKPPVRNFTVEDKDKIDFPGGYIRTADMFYEKYHLCEIIAKVPRRRNISYALQLSDFYNYIANRFFVWGSVQTMFYKNAVINLVSILEALLLECANNICCNPSECGNSIICPTRFNKNERNKVLDALDRINLLNITTFSDEEIKRIKTIIGYRNRVHIRLATENEFKSDDFTIKLYNEVIGYLQRICEDIYNNGLPLYHKCNKS